MATRANRSRTFMALLKRERQNLQSKTKVWDVSQIQRKKVHAETNIQFHFIYSRLFWRGEKIYIKKVTPWVSFYFKCWNNLGPTFGMSHTTHVTILQQILYLTFVPANLPLHLILLERGSCSNKCMSREVQLTGARKHFPPAGYYLCWGNCYWCQGGNITCLCWEGNNSNDLLMLLSYLETKITYTHQPR